MCLVLEWRSECVGVASSDDYTDYVEMGHESRVTSQGQGDVVMHRVVVLRTSGDSDDHLIWTTKREVI